MHTKAFISRSYGKATRPVSQAAAFVIYCVYSPLAFWHTRCYLAMRREKARDISMRGSKKMKKYLAAFVMMAMMAVMVPLMATDASAQTYRKRTSERYYEQDDRNIYDKHRNVINIGIGAGAGAIVGGLLGGKKGALWGALAGGGAGAVYTYKINPKTKKYERVYLRR